MKRRPGGARVPARPSASPVETPGDWLGAAMALFASPDEAVGLCELEPPHRIRAANAVFAATVPNYPASVVGRPLLEVVPRWSDEAFAAMLARAAKRTGTLSRLEHLPSPPRWFELTLTRDSFPGVGNAILYRMRDVTARELRIRELEGAVDRLGAVMTVATVSGSLATDRVPACAADGASKICEGPAAVCLRGADGLLQVTASTGLRGDDGLWTMLARDWRLPVPAAIANGETRIVAVNTSLPIDIRAPLASVNARWVVAVPIEGQRGALGAVFTVWPRLTNPRGPDLRSIETIAGQLAISLEHAAALKTVDPVRAIIHALPHAVVAIDLDGRITVTNAAFEDRFGVPADARRSLASLLRALSMRSADGAPVDPATHPLGRALKGDAVRGGPYSAIDPGSGRECRMDVSAGPVHDPRRGSVIGATSIWIERIAIAAEAPREPLSGHRAVGGGGGGAGPFFKAAQEGPT